MGAFRGSVGCASLEGRQHDGATPRVGGHWPREGASHDGARDIGEGRRTMEIHHTRRKDPDDGPAGATEAPAGSARRPFGEQRARDLGLGYPDLVEAFRSRRWMGRVGR